MTQYTDPYRAFRDGRAGWGGQSFDLGYEVGSAYTGSDVRAFVLPTFKAHGPNGTFAGVFQAPAIESLVDVGNDINLLDAYLNQSYISNLAGVSLSTHRDKYPVQTLGRLDPCAFVGSRRTVAGSLIFWMTDASPISQLLSAQYRYELLHADELPPFDLYLTFQTEDNTWSSAVIYGISILDEGVVIENGNNEGIAVNYSYMALDATPVTPGFFSMLTAAPFASRAPLVARYESGAIVNRVSASGAITSAHTTRRGPQP